MADPRAMSVRRAGQAIAPESLAPLPADWATAPPTLTVVPHPDDPSMPMLMWVRGTAGGDPVTGDGWNFGWNTDWDD